MYVRVRVIENCRVITTGAGYGSPLTTSSKNMSNKELN